MDAQNFDPLFGKANTLDTNVPAKAPEFQLIDSKQFVDQDIQKAQEEGSVQYASGVVRVSDAPKFPEVVSSKPLYDESQNFGLNRRTELRAKLGLGDDKSFTDYNNQNKFVPQGFELEARLLLHEEKVQKLESEYKNGVMGYQTFLFKAYGADLLKQNGHDIYSSLYWYNRRKQGLFDSPLDNMSQMRVLLKQAEDLYQAEDWFNKSNSTTLDTTMAAYIAEGVLPPEKVRDLFPEVFEALDEVYESDAEKVKLYRAGLLSFPKGEMPTIDSNGDGKPDYYFHTDGKLYRVADAGSAKAGEGKAYYNADGSLDRIVVNELLGEGGDSFVKGFANAFSTIYEVVVGIGTGLVDTIKNIVDQDEWKFDLLENWYVDYSKDKASSYLFGNNVFTTSSGFQNADGSFDYDGLWRGAFSTAGTIAGMLATVGIGKLMAGVKTGAQVAAEAAKQAGTQVAKRTLVQGVKDLGLLGIQKLGALASTASGISQGAPVFPTLARTTASATLQGLTYLAARDFTTSVASLTARQEQLGISNSDIITNSAMMAGVNMGVSYLLRSTMDKSALIRHAQGSMAKLQAAERAGKAASALDKGFVELVMGFAKKSPKGFALVSTGMDMMENVITMATSASVSQTGELFNADVIKGMFNPQTVLTQLALGRLTYNGGFSKANEVNEGIRTGGTITSLGNLMKQNTKVIADLDSGIAAARNKNNNAAVETLVNLKNQYLATAKSDPNNLIGSISKAMFELHDKMKDPQTGDSFVKSFLKKSFDLTVQKDVLADIALTYDVYKAVVGASNKIYKDAFLKGNLLDGAVVNGIGKSKFDKIYNKLVSMQKLVLQVELPVAEVAFKRFVEGVNVDFILKSKMSREAESLLSKVELISGNPEYEQVLETGKDGNPVYRTITKTVLDQLSPDQKAALQKVFNEAGLPEDAFNNGTLIRLPGMGTADEGTQAFKDLEYLFSKAAELSSLEGNQQRIIYPAGKGVYFLPSLGDPNITLKSAATVSTLIKGLFGLRYAEPQDQANFFKGLVGIVTGSEKISSDADKRVAIKLLSNLLKGANTPNGKPSLTFSQAVRLLSTPEFKEIFNDQSLKMNIPDEEKAIITSLLQFKTAVDDFQSFKEMMDEVKAKGMKVENSNDFKKFIESLSKLSDVQQKEMFKTFGITEAIFNELKSDYLRISSNPQKSQEYFESNLKAFLAGGKSDGANEVGNFVVKQLSILLGSSSAAENSVRPELSGQQFTIRSLESGSVEHKPVFETLNILGFKDFLKITDEDLQKAVDTVYKPTTTTEAITETVEEEVEVSPAIAPTRRLITPEVPERVEVVTPAKKGVVETISKIVQKVFLKETPDNEQTYKNYPNQFKIVDINGKQIFVEDNRAFAIVEYNGVRIPFYYSSGDGEKFDPKAPLGSRGVLPQRWYFSAGYNPGTRSFFSGYINKPGNEFMINFANSKVIKAMSEYLQDTIIVPKLSKKDIASDQDIAFYNTGLKPLSEPPLPDSPAEKRKPYDDNLQTVFNLIMKIDPESRNYKETIVETKPTPDVPAVTRVIPKVEAVYEDVPGVSAKTEKKSVTKTIQPAGTVRSEQNTKVFNEIKDLVIEARFNAFLKFMGVENFDNLDSTRSQEANSRLISIYNDRYKTSLTYLSYDDFTVKTKLFSDNSILENGVYSVSLNTRIQAALNAHAKVYVQDTKVTSGNRKLYIDLSTFAGRRMSELAEKIINRPNDVSNAIKRNKVEEMIQQFSINNPTEFLTELQKERSFLARLHKKYPSGFIVFENIDSGSFPDDLRKLLNAIGYGEYDLAETFGSIPGLFYKSDKFDSAIELTFKTTEQKELFKNFLNGKADEANSKAHFQKIIDIAEKDGKYDFRLAMHESVGLFTTVNNDTIINLSGNALLSDINPNTMRFSEYVDTVLANDITIKQGRNAGNLIKMFLTSASGYGLVGDSDTTLRNNLMLITAINGIDSFQKATLNNKADVERKFTLEEIQLFKDSGLWTFVSKVTEDTPMKDRPDLKLETWVIKPVENFKEKALKYLANNQKVNPIVILPLLKTDMMSKIPGIVGYNPATGTTAITTNFLNYTANNFTRTLSVEAFNKFFTQDMVDINLKGHDTEQDFVKEVSGKSVNVILSNEFAKKYVDNVYYIMLANTLRGSLKINESVKNLFKENDINFRMFEALGDYNVREIIGAGLNAKKSNKQIAEDVNNYLKSGDKKTKVNIKDFKDAYIQRVGLDDNESVVSASDVLRLIPSYNYGNLKFEETDIADIRKVLTNGDIFVKDSVLLNYEQMRSNNIEANDFSIIKAMMDQAAEEPAKAINFFVNNLESLNTRQFDLLVKTLTDFGVSKGSIDILKTKFAATEELYSTVEASNITKSRQLIIDNTDPSFIQTDEYIFYGSPNSNKKAVNEAILHAKNMAVNTSSRKTMMKVSQTENLKGDMAESIKKLSDVIEINNRANNGESRLIPNLALQSELGNLADSLSEFTKMIMGFDFGNNSKLSKEDAFNLAWNMYIHSTGVDMSKNWTKYLFYDTKEKKVVSLANTLGRGPQSINKLMEASLKFFKKEDAGRYVLFSMDKNMLHNARIATGGKLKYMLLNEPNIEIMKDIFVKNAYIQSEEFKKNTKTTPELLKGIVSRVYGRTVDLGDIKDVALSRFANIPGVNPKLIDKLFLSMSSYKRNLNLSDQAFENSILLGGDYTLEQKDIINLKQQYINDVLRYLVHHSELSDDIKNELTRATSALIKANRKLLNSFRLNESDIDDMNTLINKNDFVSFNNKIKALFGPKQKSIDQSNESVLQLFNLLVNYNILTTRDGKSLNFLLNESNSNLLQRKDEIKNQVTHTFSSGITKDLRDIAKEGFNVLDIEVLYDTTKGISNVFQVVYKTYDGVNDLESFVNNNLRVKPQGKETVIYVPVFVDVKDENGKDIRILWNRQASNKYKIQDVFPEYYKNYYNNPNAKGAKIAFENYLLAMDRLPKNFKESDLANYVGKQLVDNGKATLTFNGKLFDIGDRVMGQNGNFVFKSGKLLDQGLIQSDSFVLLNQLDVLTDLVRNSVLIDRAFNASNKLDDLSKHLGLNQFYTNGHDALNDADVTAEVALRFIQNADLIKHKQTDLFDLIQKIGDNFFVKKEGQTVNYSERLNFEKITKDGLSDESKQYIRDYKLLFDDSKGNEKLTQITKAINATVNDLNYYYYKIDFDVQKKKLYYETDNLYASQKDHIDNLQDGGSTRIASILEYVINKQNGKSLKELYPDEKTILTEDFSSKPNYNSIGTPLRNLYEILRDSFGVTRVDENGETYKLLDANALRSIFGLTEEEFFKRLITVNKNAKGISLEDYKANRATFNGGTIKDIFTRLSDSDEGKSIRNANARNSLTYKFINNVTPIFNFTFGYKFLGKADSTLRTKLEEEFSTFAMRNNRYEDDQAFIDRVSRSKKFIESSEVQLARQFLESNSFLQINYESIYRLVTPAVRNKKYESIVLDKEINRTDYAKGSFIKSNEIGIKLSELLKLTGLKNMSQLYNAYPGGEIYIPVMRHPGDHPGSVSYYKAVILTESNPTSIVLNEDIVKGIMFGDFDGDHVTILKPNLFAQEFSKDIDSITKIGYKALDYVLGDEHAFKFESDAKRVFLLNKISNQFGTNIIKSDLDEIKSQKTDLDKINKYNELKAIRQKELESEGLTDKDLNIVWINAVDVSNAFVNKRYEFYSLNKNFGKDKANVQAIKNVSLAKSMYFVKQSLNDTVYGEMQKRYAYLDESVTSEDPRKVFVFAGVSLTDNTIDLLNSNIPNTVKRLDSFLDRLNFNLIVSGKKGFEPLALQFLKEYLNSGVIKDGTDVVAFLNTLERMVQSSDFFKETIKAAIPKLNELTKQNTSVDNYQNAFNVFAKSRLVTKDRTPESGILLFDAAAKQFTVLDLLLSENGENWSAFSSDQDLVESYVKQKLYEVDNKSTKFYNNLDLKDKNGNTYSNYVEANIVLDLTNSSKAPEDTFVLLNDKLGYGKIAAITMDQFDEVIDIDLKEYTNKVLKEDLQITKKIRLSAGDKFLGIHNYNGELMVLVSKIKPVDGSSKLALFQAKVGKGVVSGTIDNRLRNALSKAGIEADILYSARNFDFGKFSPLFSANTTNLRFFDGDGKEIFGVGRKGKTPENARFATLRSPVAVVEDGYFWNQSLKDSVLDETTFSNNTRSLEGMVLVGNKLINIDNDGNFVYDNEMLNKMNTFWRQYKAPLLADYNAMRMHHLNMLTVILSKIPTKGSVGVKKFMDDNTKRLLVEKALTSVGFSGKEGLNQITSLVNTYIFGNGLTFEKLNLNDVEKFILSEGLYDKFTNPQEIKSLNDAKDIKTKSSYYLDIRKDNKNIFGNVKVSGQTAEQDRTRIDKNGKQIYVQDGTNGFFSMKNYVNSFIDYINFNKLSPNELQPLSNADIENGTYKNIFNYALGFVDGYQTNSFRSIAYSDAYIRDPLLNVSNNSAKTNTPTNPIVVSQSQLQTRMVTSDVVDDNIDYQKAYKDMNFGKRSFATTDLRRFVGVNENKQDGTVSYDRLPKEEVESTVGTRFRYELMNGLANTKTNLGRAALYGWADDLYTLTMSPKRLVYSDTDNQLHFVFDSRMKEVTADNLEQTIKDSFTSHKFFEYEELRKNNISNSIDDVFKNQNEEFGDKTLSYKDTDDVLYERLKEIEDNMQDSLFGDVAQMKAAEMYLEMYPEKATTVVQSIADRHRARINKGEEKNMSYLFQRDLLESRGIRLRDNLSFEADEMLGDIAKDAAYLKRDLSMKFMMVHSMAAKRNVVVELNEFSRLLGMVSWIDHLTKLGNQNPKEKGAYDLQIEAHLKQNKTTYAEALKKVEAFGKNHGDIVAGYVNFMDEVKMHAKTYSRLNNEVSDDWFWLVTPNIYTKTNQTKVQFMRSALFSYSKPDSNAIGNMYMNYNFYDSIKNTIDVLGTSASYHNFAKRAIDSKFMENNTVFNFASETVEKALVGMIPEIKTYTDGISEFEVFLATVKGMVPGVITNDFTEEVNAGNLGNGLYGVYKQLKEFLNKKAITYADAQEKYRLAENDPETKKEMDTIMKAYSLSNDIIASLLMKSKKSAEVIDTIYNSIKLDAESRGLSIVDNRGRLLREDVGSYRSLGNFSSEYVANIFKYYSPFNGGFKANVILDALNGDVFYMNKSLAEHADEFFFTKKEPGMLKKLMLKAQSVATSLLMSSPLKLPDRFLMYSGADFGFLSLANPFTLLKAGEATNKISEYLQSGGKVLDPDLKEYMLARGIDIKNQNLNMILNETDEAVKTGNILKPLTEPANKALSIQHEWTRFAAFLAIKEDLMKHGGQAKWLGSAYQYKDLLKDAFTDKFDDQGNLLYSKEARQALFIVGRQIGSTGDFPILAKKLNGWLMFTTFPLAMARWARGEFKSLSTAATDLIFSADKRADSFRFLASQGLGVFGIYAVMNFLLSTIAAATGVDDETEEEWKEKQVAPEIVKSILLGGKPVMTPYNSFNPIQILIDATVKPFLPDENNPDKSLMDSIFEFGMSTVASRGNPAIRLAAELMGGVDIIGGTIYDNTDKYSLWENFQRKIGAYFIGAAGANALTNYLNKDLPTMDLTFEKALGEGISRVYMAELGNSRAYKSEVKNYYKANSIIQAWRFAESEDTSTENIYGNSTFDQKGYQTIKNEIAAAMSRKAKPAQIYSIIMRALEGGMSLKEVRSAVNNNSIQYKLNSIKDVKSFMDSLSEGDLNTIKDALAYEQELYPWLDALRLEIDNEYKKQYYNTYSPRAYFRTYGPRFPQKTYFSNNRRYYNSSNYYPLYGRQNPFSAYRSSWFRLNNLDKPKEED